MFKVRKVSILAFLSSILISVTVQAYDPPIGIPDPSGRWGALDPIDDPVPARPSSWVSEQVGFYYVDPAIGTDTGNTYGFPGKPRATLPKTVNPGAYVEATGIFNTSQSANWVCTEANPCWLVGKDGAEPVFQQQFFINGAEYLFVDNIESTGASGEAIHVKSSGHHIIVRNSTIHDRPHSGTGGDSGIAIGAPADGVRMHDIISYNNRLLRLGDVNVSFDQDFHGHAVTTWGRDYALGTELHHIWVLDNYCEEVSGNCTQVNGGNKPNAHLAVHNIYVGRNEHVNGRQGNTGVKQSTDVIVSQNKCRGIFPVGGNSGGCFGHQYRKDWVWFIFNEASDAAYGIRHSDTPPIYDVNNDPIPQRIFEIGNLVYDIKPNPNGKWSDLSIRPNAYSDGIGISDQQGNGLTSYIVDNTIFRTYGCIYNVKGAAEIPTYVTGNICASVDRSGGDKNLAVVHKARNNAWIMDYDWFIGDTINEYHVEYPSIDPNQTDFKTWQAMSMPQCVNCIASIGAPSGFFVKPTIDPNTRDFRLVTGAPGIGANSKSPAYQMFYDRYGIDIYVDFNGNPRHPTNPSMGAFEIEGTAVPVTDPPTPPENFTVIDIIQN